MFRVEMYKIRHSPNIIFVFIVTATVALFFGKSITQMEQSINDSLFSVAFASSSSVLMLYFAVLSSIYINRDYSSNNYRVLVGTGIGRSKILLTKFFVFLGLSIATIALHTLAVCVIPLFTGAFYIDSNQIISIFLYFLIYGSIISTIFFISIISQTLLKSILLNIVYIIFSGFSSMLVSIDSGISFILPIQSLQLVAEKISDRYLPIALISIVYMGLTYGLSHLTFLKQEL